jgi:hypothetical protein
MAHASARSMTHGELLKGVLTLVAGTLVGLLVLLALT